MQPCIYATVIVHSKYNIIITIHIIIEITDKVCYKHVSSSPFCPRVLSHLQLR